MKANLKAAIELRDETVASAAVAVGIQPAQLSRIIQCRIEAPAGLRGRLAEHLDANEAWLFRDLRRIPPFLTPAGRSAGEGKPQSAEVVNGE